MKIIGLSGGIASGKNLVAEIFTKEGMAIFDADKEVHDLFNTDKQVIQKVKKEFPASFAHGEIDRKALGKIVFSDKKQLKKLEEIIHPRVRENYQKFLKTVKKEKKEFAVLNIPLLLETKGYECDYIVAIILPKALQKQRFIQREKEHNPQAKIADLNKKFTQIASKQLSNLQRKKAADFIIKNDGLKSNLVAQVKEILKSLLCKRSKGS